MGKNEEIIKPIEKEVKRPFMKLLSRIAIPLSVVLLAVYMFLFIGYSWDLKLAEELTAEEWQKNKYEEKWFEYDIAGCGSFEEYEEQTDKQYAVRKPVLLIGGISIVVGIASKNAYKSGQEE